MNYKQISKITIYSTVMLIFALIGIITFALDFPNWVKYDSSFLMDPAIFTNPLEQLMPPSVQATRALQGFSLVICIVMSIMTAWEIKKMEKTDYKKYYIASVGIFTWLLLPYTVYLGVKEKLYVDFLNYNSQERDEPLQISFQSFKNGFSKNGTRNKLFWNTVFGYFVFTVTLVGFILSNIISENIFGIEVLHPINPDQLKPGFSPEDYYQTIQISPVFKTLGSFTQMTNITCFLFMLVFIFFNRKIAFRNNTVMIAVSSYIFIVLIVFWSYLFPQYIANNIYIKDLQWVKTSWSHAVTPILFIAFYITSTFLSKSAPTSIKKVTMNYLIYPLTYGLYVYPLPFYTRFSAYGSLTNLNPNMDLSIGIANVSKNGNYLMVLGILGLGLGFMIAFVGFWSISFFVNKREMKKQN